MAPRPPARCRSAGPSRCVLASTNLTSARAKWRLGILPNRRLLVDIARNFADRNIGCQRVILKVEVDLNAAAIGHRDVKQNHVGPPALSEGHPNLAIRR